MLPAWLSVCTGQIRFTHPQRQCCTDQNGGTSAVLDPLEIGSGIDELIIPALNITCALIFSAFNGLMQTMMWLRSPSQLWLCQRVSDDRQSAQANCMSSLVVSCLIVSFEVEMLIFLVVIKK